MKQLPLIYLLGTLCAGNAATYGQRPPRFEPDTNRITFDGDVMTQQRATEMAEAEGTTLVDFYACARLERRASLTDCVILIVQHEKGRVFQYQLFSRTCQGRLINQHGCFAGYTVRFRAEQENSIWMGGDGWSYQIRNRYEVSDGRRWVEVLTFSCSEWELGKTVISDGWEGGRAWEVLDGQGEHLDSGSEEWAAQPSTSSDYQPEAEVLCAARRDSVKAGRALEFAKTRAECETLVPESVSVTVVGEAGPLVASGGLEGTAAWGGFCENIERVGLAALEKAAAAFYEDCVLHPGRYFPEYFQAEPGDLEIAELIEFRNPFPPGTAFGAVGGCHDITVTETVDMGDGITCTAPVTYRCTETRPGYCECTDPEIAGDWSCSDTNPE